MNPITELPEIVVGLSGAHIVIDSRRGNFGTEVVATLTLMDSNGDIATAMLTRAALQELTLLSSETLTKVDAT